MKKSTLIYSSIGLLLLVLLSLFLIRSCQTQAVEMPWGPWEQLSMHLRDSPDHLPAQWERVKQQKDPQLLFEFVRDNIQTIPPYLKVGSQKYRWKTQGVLRTGQGTSLEKAQLLQEGLEEIGLSPTLSYGRWDASQWESLFGPSAVPEGVLPDLEYLRQAQEDYELPPWSQSEDVLPEEEIQQFGEHLLAFAKEKHRSKSPDWENLARELYLVEVEIDSQIVLLNPSFPQAQWGESYASNKPYTYSPKKRHPATELSIKLRASYDDRSYSPFTLAEADWPLEQLIGKDIRVGFRVLGPPEILLSTPVEEFESFVSTIELLDPLGPVPDSFRISGDVITTRGKVIPKESAWNILEDDIEFRQGDASKAANISLGPPKLADFPTLLIEAEVSDEAGNPLMDLSEEDFNILVNGEKVTHRMVVNRRTPPRVLFLYDDSGSMPKEYVSHEKTLELFRQIARACHQVNPETEFAVSPFGDEETKIFKLSDWSNDAEALCNFIDRTRSGNSHNWAALLGATNIPEANMAILLTDADGTERATDYTDQRLKEGMPGLIYGVLDSYTQEDEFLKMADKSKGVYFRIEDQLAEAMADLKSRIQETKNERYLLEAEVENDSLPFMELEIQVGNEGLSASLPVMDAPISSFGRPAGKNAITGLYIEISYLNRIYSHKIAGVPFGSNPRKHPVTQELIDACNNALWGEYILHIEGSTPIPSVVLDEKCQHYLSLKPLVSLLEESNPERFFQRLQEIQWRPDFPGKLPAMLVSRDSLFENSLSLWVYSAFPDKEGQYWQTLDLLGSQESHFPTLNQEQALLGQVNFGLKQTYIVQKNYNKVVPTFAQIQPLTTYRISSYGILPGAGFNKFLHGGPNMIVALTENYIDQPRILVTQDSMRAPLGFLLANNSLNLTPIGAQGYLGGKKLPNQMDRSQPLIAQPHLWNKTLGMKMDTWMDLEGDKLAFIQAGSLGIKGLGNPVDSEQLMIQVKEKIKALILSEMDQTHIYFGNTNESWQNAFNISRNNLSALFSSPN